MKNKELILFLCAALAVSCGGGGGGGGNSGSPKSYAGTWDGTLYLTQNTCNFDGILDALQVEHLINQSGSRVVIDVPQKTTTYEGTTDGNEGFTVGQEVLNQPVGGGVSCRLTSAIRYRAAGNDIANVDNRQDFDCTNGSTNQSCTVAYSGEMTRKKQ